MKKILMAAAAAVMVIGMGLTAYAAPSYVFDISDYNSSIVTNVGSWYNKHIPGFIGWYTEDGYLMYGTSTALNGEYSYYTDCWQWLDDDLNGIAECYYFDSDGHLLVNGTSPDGYATNEYGQWVDADGIVMTQNFDVSIYSGTFQRSEIYRWDKRAEFLEQYEATGAYSVITVDDKNTVQQNTYYGHFDEDDQKPITLSGPDGSSHGYNLSGQGSWQYVSNGSMGGNIHYAKVVIWYFADEDTLINLEYVTGGEDNAAARIFKRAE